MAILPSATHAVPATPARLLPGAARQQLARDALAGQAISALADQHQVSRQFVYRQLDHAHDALDQAFASPPAAPPQLLFWLPVTKPWLHQLVLGLTLICHSSLRGVSELLADLFDYRLSLGSVHNILQQAVTSATSAPTSTGCRAWKSTATPIPGACVCWSWPNAVSSRKQPSPISPGVCVPRKRRYCRMCPAGATSFTPSTRR